MTEAKNTRISKKLVVKITLSALDPMDAEIIPVIMGLEKKSKFMRLALYSYIKGMNNQAVTPPKRLPTMEDLKLRSKISRLDDLDF